MTHLSVLRRESVEALLRAPNGLYVDGTYGRGGHSGLLLEGLGEAGRLLALDQDPEAQRSAEQHQHDGRFRFVSDNFCALEQHVEPESIDGLLLDLGMSSPQIDDAARGFSFRFDGPLDMRMDPERGQSAAEYLQQVSEQELGRVLRDYGEERYWRRIARAIIEARGRITRTSELVAIVNAASPRATPGKHPATRTFQALRIAVNRELDVLSTILEALPRLLCLGGRAAIISFHSLEDRLVKRATRPDPATTRLPRGLPVAPPVQLALRQCGKVIKPSSTEARDNPRARSAVLRILERVA